MSTSEPQATSNPLRPFLFVWLGQFLSLIGSGLTSFGLGVWIYEQTGQATPFALTVMFSTLPRLLLLPLAGQKLPPARPAAVHLSAGSSRPRTTFPEISEPFA